MIQKRTENRIHGTLRRTCAPPGKEHLLPLIVICSLILALGGSGVAVAVNGYVGLGLGNAKSNFDREHAEFAGPDVAPNQTAWRLFGGCQLNSSFGLEGCYLYLGKPRVHEEVHEDFFETQLSGYEFTLVGILPIARGLSAFARGGLVFWNSDITFRFTDTGNGSETESGNNLALGLGVKYDFLRYFGLRAEYTRYTIDKAKAAFGDVNLISVSGLFAFKL